MDAYNQKLIVARTAIAKSPKSKSTALRWYLKDHFGLLHNQVTNLMKEDLALAIKEVRNRNAPAVVKICRDCVGDGADAHCRDSVRNCQIADCLLFNVRPYQSKSKVTLGKVMPCAFLTANTSEAMEMPTSTSSSVIKRPLHNIEVNYFGLGG